MYFSGIFLVFVLYFWFIYKSDTSFGFLMYFPDMPAMYMDEESIKDGTKALESTDPKIQCQSAVQNCSAVRLYNAVILQ